MITYDANERAALALSYRAPCVSKMAPCHVDKMSYRKLESVREKKMGIHHRWLVDEFSDLFMDLNSLRQRSGQSPHCTGEKNGEAASPSVYFLLRTNCIHRYIP